MGFGRVCVCIYQIANDRAVRLFCPTNSVPLVLVLQRGINDACNKNLGSDRTKEKWCFYSSCLCPQHLVSFPLLPCYSLDSLDRHVLNHTLSCLSVRFLLLSPNFSRFQPCVYTSSGISCTFSHLLRPPQVSPLASRSRALILRMMRRSCWGARTCGCGCWLPGDVTPFLAPSSSSILPLRRFPGSLFSPLAIRSHPRPRSRSHPYPFRRPQPRPRPRPRSCSCPFFRPRFLFPVPGTQFSPLYNIARQVSGLTPDAVGYLQALPKTCRSDPACRMTLPDLIYFYPGVMFSQVLFPLSPHHSVRLIYLSPLQSPFLLLSLFPTLQIPLFMFPLPHSFCARSPVSSPVPIPAPSPSSTPTLTLTPTPNPFPSPLAPSRPSGLVLLSVQ